MLIIDGSQGEGGGQIIRSALSLAATLNQPIRIKNIRAKRKNPGLAAQHLTAVRASALICEAVISGDQLGSTQLTFIPHGPPAPGLYAFDIAEARQGGSAGAASLVLQTILWPLAWAKGPSQVTILGGTHVAWSPSFHYIQDVYLPLVAKLGLQATVTLSAWGWYPAGEGEIQVETPGVVGQPGPVPWSKTTWQERGPLQLIQGLAVASSLPAHIAQRMQNRATKLLQQAGLPVSIEPRRVRSVSPGAGLFLTAIYEHSRAGFSALGKKGKSSEQVAEEAVALLLAFHDSGAALDKQAVDQLILPLALSGRPAVLSTQALSQHTLTNLQVIEQFLGPITKVNHGRRLIEFFQRKSSLHD